LQPCHVAKITPPKKRKPASLYEIAGFLSARKNQ